MKENISMFMIPTFFLIISSINSIAYGQNENKAMDESQKFFAIQKTVTSIPDSIAPGHAQYHQIVIALPYNPNSIYVGEVSYSASSPINVFVQQTLNTTVTQNATARPLANMEGEYAIGSTILEDKIADNMQFAGSGVYFHSRSSEPFTVVYTIVGKMVAPSPLFQFEP